MKRTATVTTLFLVLLLAGCSGAKKAAEVPHPLQGNWTFSIDTPDGTYEGTMMFAETDDVLSGTIASPEMPAQSADMEALTFEEASSTVIFKFQSGGQIGEITVTATLEGDSLNGFMEPEGSNMQVPMQASRSTE